VQVTETIQRGTGSIVNGHCFAMLLFFFLNFQYFSKKNDQSYGRFEHPDSQFAEAKKVQEPMV
jgi:hypothetical protein